MAYITSPKKKINFKSIETIIISEISYKIMQPNYGFHVATKKERCNQYVLAGPPSPPPSRLFHRTFIRGLSNLTNGYVGQVAHLVCV